MGIIELWVPIVVSAIVVFAASALIWTVLPWHKSDFRKTGDEPSVRAALKGTLPGCYVLPYHMDPAELKNEAVAQKYIEGPLAYITVVPNGLPKMGGKLVLSFLNNLLVGVLCAYIVTRTLPPTAPYLEVFRISGTVAFIAYGIGYLQDSIWFGRPWSLTAKSLVDSLIYGLLTGGTFGWLYG